MPSENLIEQRMVMDNNPVADDIDHDGRMSGRHPAPLGPILLLSFLATFGTAVLWNGLAFIAKEAYAFDEAWNLALAIFNCGVYAIVRSDGTLRGKRVGSGSLLHFVVSPCVCVHACA